MSEAGVACIACPIFGYMVDASPTRKLPYLFGLILLGASMLLLAVAKTLWMFIVARLLQGGATAMVAVAGLSLITDSVSVNNLGQMIGYLGSAITLGFLLGPFLGGLVYDAAGYQAVFIVAFGIVAVDLVMRFAVIEKKVAQQWSKCRLVEHSGREYQTFPAPPEPDDRRGQFVLPLLMKQPRILISSWALLVQGLMFAAFDSVRPFPHTHKHIHRPPTHYLSKDTHRIRRNEIPLDRLRRRNDLPPISCVCIFRALLRYPAPPPALRLSPTYLPT